ncbi:MAG: hypothetical protein RR832_05780 [Bacilli bacterium]
MLNQVILVGRIIEIIKSEDENTVSIILSMPRTYKNDDGLYYKDFIECILNEDFYNKSSSSLKKLDIIGIKGRLENIELNSKTVVIVEKLTYLSCGKE